MKLGNLVVEITADSAKFVAGVADAELKFDNLGKRARSAVNDFGKYTAAATTAGVAAATYLVTSSIQSAKEIQNLADVSNTSVKTFTALAYGARQVGIENDKLADIFKDMNDRVGDFVATGGGPMADFFDNIAPKVGVTADQFRKLSGPEALQLYVSSLEKANLSQQDMTFYMEAIASDSTRLLPLLRNNGAEFARQAQEAEKLGIALTDIEADNIARAGSALDTMGEGVDSLVDKFSAQLSPVIVAIAEEFKKTAIEAGGFGSIALNAFETVVNGAAFVANAVDGIKRVFQLAADGIITYWASISARITDWVADIYGFLSKIPGNIGEAYGRLEQQMRSVSETSASVATQAWDNMDKTLSKPMAGDALKQFVEDARKAGEEAAKATVEARQAVKMPTGGGAPAAMTPEQEAKKKQLESEIEAIRQANITEMELLNQKQQQELESLSAFYEGKNELWEEFALLELETKARHEEELTELERKAAEERLRKAEEEARDKQQIMSQALSGLTSLMNSENRKMFEIGKAASISQSIISTYTGMTKALELGWPLGPIAASAIAATGFAQVQSIRQQSFGGGGGSSGTATQSVNAASTPVNQPGGQQPPQQMIVSGIDEGELFSGGRVRSIVGELLEYQRNGGQVILA